MKLQTAYIHNQLWAWFNDRAEAQAYNPDSAIVQSSPPCRLLNGRMSDGIFRVHAPIQEQTK